MRDFGLTLVLVGVAALILGVGCEQEQHLARFFETSGEMSGAVAAEAPAELSAAELAALAKQFDADELLATAEFFAQDTLAANPAAAASAPLVAANAPALELAISAAPSMQELKRVAPMVSGDLPAQPAAGWRARLRPHEPPAAALQAAFFTPSSLNVDAAAQNTSLMVKLVSAADEFVFPEFDEEIISAKLPAVNKRSGEVLEVAPALAPKSAAAPPPISAPQTMAAGEFVFIADETVAAKDASAAEIMQDLTPLAVPRRAIGEVDDWGDELADEPAAEESATADKATAEPAAAADSAGTVEAADADVVEAVETADTAEAAEAAETAETKDVAETTEVAETAEASDVAEAAEITDTAEVAQAPAAAEDTETEFAQGVPAVSAISPAATKLTQVVAMEKIRREANLMQAKQYYRQGVELYDISKYQAALAKFEQALLLNPELKEAAEYRRQARQLLGRPAEDGSILIDSIADMRQVRLRQREMQVAANLEKADSYLLSALNPGVERQDLPRAAQIQRSLSDLDAAGSMLETSRVLLRESGLPRAAQKNLSLRLSALKGQIAESRRALLNELGIIERNEAQAATNQSRVNAAKLHRDRTDEMFKQVQLLFDKAEYEESLRLLERMQQIDKSNVEITEWIRRVHRREAQDFNAYNADNLRRVEDAWSVDVDAAKVMPRHILTYPYDWERVKQRAAETGSVEQLSAEKRRILNILDETRGSFDYREQELNLVLDDFRRRTGINIMLDKDVDGTALIDLPLKDVTMRTALDVILENSEPRLDFRIKDQAVEIYVQGTEGSDEKVLKIYPVADIITQMKNFSVSTSSEWGDDDDDDDDDEWETENIDLIPTIGNMLPSVNAEELEIWNDNLLVLETPDVQAKIAAYLDQLRAASQQQVLVEGRFMNISDEYMEMIGFDWYGTKQTESADGGKQLMSGVRYNPMNKPLASNQVVGYGGIGSNSRLGGLDSTFNYLWSKSPVNYMLNSLHVNFALHAAARNEAGSVMNNPKVLVPNARQAYCRVVVETPYRESYNIINESAIYAPAIYRQGVTWQARPIISFDGKYITVNVKPRVEEVDSENSTSLSSTLAIEAGTGDNSTQNYWYLTVDLPVTRETLFDTNATVPDGGSILIGGQLRDATNESSSGIPVLSSIPYLGRLMRTDISQSDRLNRVIIVSAKIVELNE